MRGGGWLFFCHGIFANGVFTLFDLSHGGGGGKMSCKEEKRGGGKTPTSHMRIPLLIDFGVLHDLLFVHGGCSFSVVSPLSWGGGSLEQGQINLVWDKEGVEETSKTFFGKHIIFFLFSCEVVGLTLPMCGGGK